MECSRERKGEHLVKVTQEIEESALEIGADKISSLPEPIVHKIMSLLPTKYAIRTSSLSKKWEFFWSSFPEVILKEVNIRGPAISISGPQTFIQCRRRFVRYMQQTLSHRCMENLDKLEISTFQPGNKEIYDVVDGFIDAAIKGRLKGLDLKFPNTFHHITVEERGCEVCYKLPEVMFSFGSSLVFLKVEGCHVMEFNNLVSFPFLTFLSMKNTHITESFLERIIGSCPALESLSLQSCHGLKAFRISHSKVRQFALGGFTEMEDIKIDAPSVLSFKFLGNYIVHENGDDEESGFNPSNDVYRFHCLNTLTLVCVSIKAETMNLVLSNLLNLTTLKIKSCRGSERLLISGESLTNLVIKDSDFLENVEIQAQKLRVINYAHNRNGFGFKKMGFNFLQSLSIKGNDDLTGSNLEYIVSCSPLLVALVLKSCTKMERIIVSSASLECLVIKECLNLNVVTILAPKLLVLKYTGPVLMFPQLSTSYKLSVELFLKEPSDDQKKNKDLELVTIWEFLHKFSGYAKSMMVQCKSAEFMMMPKDLPSPIDYLKKFNVQTWLMGVNLFNLLQRVLGISYCFKTLCIELTGSRSIELEFKDFSNEELLERLRSNEIHDCVKEHLIEVRARNLEGKEDEIKLIEYLLGQASVLRTMSISKIFATHTRRSEFMEKVKNLPKASSNVEIVYS